LRKLHLDPRVTSFGDGAKGRILAQRPRAGVAAAENMTVRLVVGRA
jgi:beta-lactam-binding protein with PASTA domain